MQKPISFAFLALLLIISLSGCQMGSGFTGNLFSMTPPDATLTTRVQQALYHSQDPVIANVRAESIEGTVILSGYVKKIRQSDEAEMLARNVQGVRQVENNIIVRQ